MTKVALSNLLVDSRLSLRYHGGHCCGVKHLASFEGIKPDSLLSEVSLGDPMFLTSTGFYYLLPGAWQNSARTFPREIAVLRLYRILDYAVNISSAQRIEVTLIERQKEQWEPILLEMGFKQVGEDTLNSNTGQLISTYWLVYSNSRTKKRLPALTETLGKNWAKVNKEQMALQKKYEDSLTKASPAPFF